MAGVPRLLPRRPLLVLVALTLLVGALPVQRAHGAAASDGAGPSLAAQAPLRLEPAPRLAYGDTGAAKRVATSAPRDVAAAAASGVVALGRAELEPDRRIVRARRFLLWGSLRLDGG